jgi:hypothetical protein
MATAESRVRWHSLIVESDGGDTRELKIRPLTFDDIHALLVVARESGWYGNGDLVRRVVEAGVEGGAAAVGDIAFTIDSIAREVWTLTLRDIVARARVISRGAGVSLKLPRIRKYSYDELATPGMLLHLADKCENFDVSQYTREMVEMCVVKITVHGRVVTDEERADWIEKTFEWLAETVLNTHGMEGKLIRRLPDALLPTLAHRFFAATQLFMTLDWVQYRAAVYAFNHAVESAARRSHQLGGIDAQKASPLVTGLPLFFETVVPTATLPVEIAAQLMYDAGETPLKEFTPHERSRVKQAAREALLSVRDRVRAMPGGKVSDSDRDEIATAVLTAFVRDVSRFPRLVRRACLIYVDSFRKHSNRALRRELDGALLDFVRFVQPDTYLLVEGPSDETYFEWAIALIGGHGPYVKVEAREGSSSISRRARDLIRDGARSIATVVDRDAPKDYEELKRLFAKLSTSEAFILGHGVVEDQFSTEVHAAALNLAYPEGDAVLPEDLDGRDIVAVLKRVAWKKKLASFDKVRHARTIVRMLKSPSDVPAEIRRVAEAVIEHSKRAAVETPKLKSYLSLDARTRATLRRLHDHPDA